MSSHTLSQKEIESVPVGRMMNALVHEYVFQEHPTRWSNGKQQEVRCHWFEEHPRSCAEDDGGYCSADSLPDYSGDVTRAMAIAQAPALLGKSLSTFTEPPRTDCDGPNGRFWASFAGIPFDQRSNYRRAWLSADSLPLAICRAALLSV